MPLGPINKGDTGIPINGQFMQNMQPYPLTVPPTAVRIHMWQAQSQTHKLGKGTVTFPDWQQGMFSYKMAPQDSDTPGLWDVWAEIYTPQNGRISSMNVEKLQINDRVLGYVRNAIGRMKVSNATAPVNVPVP